jgi:hypothetical protein
MAGLVACAQTTDQDHPAQARRRGAGRVTLPVDGYAWFGAIDLARNGVNAARDIRLSPTQGGPDATGAPTPGGPGSPPTHLTVAIWWPEGLAADPHASQRAAHNVVTLELSDPNAHTYDGANGTAVWQRADGKISASVPGDWTIHIQGEHLVAATQRVYWFAWAHD